MFRPSRKNAQFLMTQSLLMLSMMLMAAYFAGNELGYLLFSNITTSWRP